MAARLQASVSRFDAIVCVVVLAFGTVVTNLPENGDVGILATLLMPAAVLPLLLRRSAPLLGCWLLALGIVVSGLPSFDQIRCGFALPVGLLLTYSVAARPRLGEALTGLVAIAAGAAFLCATDPFLSEDPAGAAGFVTALVGGFWIGGRVAGARDRAAAELAARTAELEARREANAALAVEVERVRLASDLDAAARDSVREIVELASAGERDIAGAAERCRRIETTGRRALNEMRALLGSLRTDERTALAPQPTLAQLDALLAGARAGGRAASLTIEGRRRALGASVELAAYRAVQHALAAVRAPVEVQLNYAADALQLEVTGDTAVGELADVASIAARERVVATGGSCEIEPSREGRWVLRATFPATA